MIKRSNSQEQADALSKFELNFIEITSARETMRNDAKIIVNLLFLSFHYVYLTIWWFF